MTINARHRKHYKAGAVRRPEEAEENRIADDAWWDRIKAFLLRRAA